MVSLADVTKYLSGARCRKETRECMTRLKKASNLWRYGPIHKVRALAQEMKLGEGLVVHELCRIMAGTSDQRAALGLAYNWLHDRQRLSRVQKTKRFESIGDAAVAFREGRGQQHMQLAITYVSDAQVALVGFVESWNEQRMDATREALDSDLGTE